ncbi:MAG: PAS domain-containing protein [Pseudomonadota bacterium]|nr:PAS domain-containing protein [Pseudomonadota bacterium]
MDLMHVDIFMAETFLGAALTAVLQGTADLHQALDTLPVPIYMTNAGGMIIYYNWACVGFAGRTPRVGQDSWCVSWKLYTEAGQLLAHDQCPMAVAIRERQAVRGVRAIAERPDGTCVSFLPYPTPLLDEDGDVVGAINMFIDVTECEPAPPAHKQAVGRRLRSDLGPISEGDFGLGGC